MKHDTPINAPTQDEIRQRNQVNESLFQNHILSLKELKDVKDAIEKWKSTGTGINSIDAMPIVDSIVKLCIKTRNYGDMEAWQKTLDKTHPWHPDSISETYSQPIQTGINQWSVFVRKLKGLTEVIGVIEHKFVNEDAAKVFAGNNWNLGDYY